MNSLVRAGTDADLSTWPLRSAAADNGTFLFYLWLNMLWLNMRWDGAGLRRGVRLDQLLVVLRRVGSIHRRPSSASLSLGQATLNFLINVRKSYIH